MGDSMDCSDQQTAFLMLILPEICIVLQCYVKLITQFSLELNLPTLIVTTKWFTRYLMRCYVCGKIPHNSKTLLNSRLVCVVDKSFRIILIVIIF